MLSFEVQNTIHVLFIVMWVTGTTPKDWKVSDTVLIDKNKGLETDITPTGLWGWPTPCTSYGHA
jgi:hypothetical protein